MAAFLCLRLHGPLASWGDVAVGERRPSTPHPSRSAVLGILAAALGVRRDDAESWSELDRKLGFASRTDAPGHLLVDYHTAQGPDEKLLRAEAGAAKRAGRSWHRPATRRAELSFPRRDLSTMLSSRQYRVDAVWTIAVWARGEGAAPRWSLEALADALRRPCLVPYLGRKSCPLDVPMEPQVVEAADPAAAMAAARFRTDDVLDPVRRAGEGKGSLQWEGEWSGLVPDRTVRRRDRVSSRARWQFAERDEHQRQLARTEGGGDVPEQG